MRVISFSLWGNNARYVKGAFENIELAGKLYPGWRCCFSVPEKYVWIPELKMAGATCLEWAESDARYFWRFWVAGIPGIQTWIIRDADSRLNEREVAAVEEWLAGDKDYHTMADHPWHFKLPIMAGMWGGRKPIPGLIDLINGWPKVGAYGEDECFLKAKVWPLIEGNCLRHGADKPFPKHLPTADGIHFVGERISVPGEE